MKYGYKLLRGADFDKKGAVDETLRDQRFDVLKAKLPDVLNVHNWHEFLKSIMNAGYLSGDLILSGNAIYYTYAFYLIAKYRFNASYNENMHLTSLWFFYASMVSLYTGSFESTVENHLNSIKELTTLEEYKRFILSRVVERLTNDYFDITLIGSEGLAVSGRGNNAWNAYVAALNILNAKILFSKSNLLVSKLFESGTDGKRKSLEKHHLFPKAYDISPREFEAVIERVLQDEGFETKLTQQTRDGGRDIIATKYEMGKPVVFYIECKRYGRQNSVGVNIVRSLYGVQSADQINKAILVTTGHVTRGARRFVDGQNTMMSVIDIEEIHELIQRSARKYRGY